MILLPRPLRSAALPAGFLLLAAPLVARAGGPEVEALALATLVQPETLDGGSLLGPVASRGTWYSLGGLRPFEGEAMALFSTGVLDTPPVPGTDLSAVGVDDDFAGVNFSLEVPQGMRSMRFAVRIIAPPSSLTDPDSVLDRVRVEVSGDPLSLDPWLLGDLSPDSVALRPDTAGLLDGTRYEGSLLSEWIQAVVPVQPLTQIPVLFQVRDGGLDAFGDLVMLLDGIAFEPAIPLGVPPGLVPAVERITPERLPEGITTEVLVEGRELPRDAEVALVNADGLPSLNLGPANVSWRSRERLVLTVPGLDSSTLGLRITWGDGASLTWPDALRIDTPPPSVDSVRPDVSPPRGGGLAVVHGGGFHDVSSIRVGDTEVTEYSVLGPERIELVVPPGEAGPARLLVIADGGSVERSAAVLYSAPEPGDDDATPSPAGPTVVSCSVSGSPLATAWLLLPLLCLRRRR